MTALEIALAGYLSFGQLTGNYYEAIVKHCGLQVIHADGAVTLRLAETGREEMSDADSKTVVIRLRDELYPFEVTRYVKSWNDCGAVETWVEIRHAEGGPVRLLKADSFASQVDVKTDVVRVLTLTGQGKYEANVSDAEVVRGQYVQYLSCAGTRDAWESNPAMMVSFGKDVTEESGKVLGVALEWTGTSCKRVRRNWDGKRIDVFAGIDMTTGPYTLDPNVTFKTPKAVLVWSENGRGEVSRQYHRWAHRHLMPHGYDLHPVLLNSWEGSYFSFTEQTLLDMMDGVKEMGGEMFVLDDGWFGRGKYARDDKNRDKTGLGDWCVNEEKLPRGLGFLADEAERRGLKFGLWVEPEMANTNSWLYESHPEWILREKGRPVVVGRGKSQVVLDFANPAVRDNLFEQLDAVYSGIPKLAYVKWDCNANIHNPGSTYIPADRQPNLWYDYTRGYEELLARFEAKRPQIMTQACASGGGHMDFGSLRYADEFWPSDCTDPHNRIFIQWGALQFYPASAMACHVTASPCHQTKRETPLKYRFDVAMMGRLGFELHPKNMTPEELAFAKAAVADYKRIRPVVQCGDLYRLVSPYENPLAALMFVNEKKDAAVLLALGLRIKGERTDRLRLRGLDPAATYSVREINRGEKLHFADEADGGKVVRTGRELMDWGLNVRLAGDYDSAVFEISVVAGAAPAGVRMMSYNILHGKGADGKVDIGRTAEAIIRERPDFVGLQEVDCRVKRSGGIDEPAELARLTGMHATFASAFPYQGGEYGRAVLSREKPLSVERIRLDGKHPGVLLLCEFGDFWFGTMHLDLVETNRLRQVEIVRAAVAAKSGAKPVFLTGDWNATPKSTTLEAMRGFMTVLSKETDRTFHGYKGKKALEGYCIDYIAVDSAHAGAASVAESHVTPNPVASDHNPVVATLSLAK